jgi:hypothetical protein
VTLALRALQGLRVAMAQPAPLGRQDRKDRAAPGRRGRKDRKGLKGRKDRAALGRRDHKGRKGLKGRREPRELAASCRYCAPLDSLLLP